MANLKYFLILLLCIKFSKCSKKFEGFVVKGKFAKIADHPHAVFLDVRCGNGDGWICGSSILNQMILLTAAHCLAECGGSIEIDVYAGHEDLRKVKQFSQTNKALIHQDFDQISVRNDIGLVLLIKPLILGELSKRIIIKHSFPHGDVTGVVTGWGTVNDETEEGTFRMKMVEQKLMTEEEIEESDYYLEPGMMLGGNFDYDADRPSTGDSGSGLVTSSLQEIGLVSFMVPPRRALIIYTNVSYYYPWILKQSMLLYCETRWEED